MMLLIKVVILQTVVFGLVLFFMKKILTGDTESAVNRLNESYEEVRKKKEELTQRITEIEAEYAKRKEEADKISGQIVDKAKSDGDAKKEEILREAKKEGEAIIMKAMGTMDSIRREVNRELGLKTLDFCATLLKGVFSSKVATGVHLVFVNDFIEEMEALDMSKIGPEVDRVEVVTYQPLAEEYKKRIIGTVTAKLKRPVTLEEQVDAALLGGVIVKFGGLAVDGSLAGRINESAVERKHGLEE
ncbi:MAG: F0F1 ATP synthase subunit delta [Candidatus Omnitrophota bacterium]